MSRKPLSFVGESDAIRAIRDLLPVVAASSSTVLITGESGTGKEIVARSLHDLSHRANANMNRIDVLKFADSLFEKLDRYNVHKWVEWAWKFDLKPHGMDGIARIFTRSDMHYLDVLHQIKCAETIGKVAYAHFFFTTMLHRFTTRIPTWSDEAAIPSTLRDILLIIDEFSEQPILDGGRTRGGSTRY